jgi:hypothetical protein
MPGTAAHIFSAQFQLAPATAPCTELRVAMGAVAIDVSCRGRLQERVAPRDDHGMNVVFQVRRQPRPGPAVVPQRRVHGAPTHSGAAITRAPATAACAMLVGPAAPTASHTPTKLKRRWLAARPERYPQRDQKPTAALIVREIRTMVAGVARTGVATLAWHATSHVWPHLHCCAAQLAAAYSS